MSAAGEEGWGAGVPLPTDGRCPSPASVTRGTSPARSRAPAAERHRRVAPAASATPAPGASHRKGFKGAPRLRDRVFPVFEIFPVMLTMHVFVSWCPPYPHAVRRRSPAGEDLQPVARFFLRLPDSGRVVRAPERQVWVRVSARR